MEEKKPAVEEEAPPPNMAEGSRRPEWGDMQKLVVEFVMCASCLVCSLWTSLLVIVSLLLSYANTPDVRGSCAGFWDFMLVSILSPVIIPVLYCLLSCCAWPWKPFSGGCMLIMGIACLHLTITCSENRECMEAIRRTTPPLPWLIYMGWLKSSLYLAGAVSSFVAWYQGSRPHQPYHNYYGL